MWSHGRDIVFHLPGLKRAAVASYVAALLILVGGPPIIKAHAGLDSLDSAKIIDSSIDATQRQWRSRLNYTYTERQVSRHRDLVGTVKSEEVDLWQIFLVNGFPNRQLVERYGRARIPRLCVSSRKKYPDAREWTRDPPAAVYIYPRTSFPKNSVSAVSP